MRKILISTSGRLGISRTETAGVSTETKTLFITGATSGLGKVAALKAARQGATVVALTRDKAKGEALVNENGAGSGRIVTVSGDLKSFQNVVAACDEIKANYPKLDMIINNAGIMNFKRRQTVDGIEETLQVNVLSHVLICHLLFDQLKQSTDGKIIFTSSGLHQGGIQFDDLEFKRKFTSFKVYRQSKLGVILLCRLLAEPMAKHNIGIYSQHPGMVNTDLGRDAGWFSRMIFRTMGTTPEKGSETLSYLVETPNDQLEAGAYYTDKQVAQTTHQSYDLETARRLLEAAHNHLAPYIRSPSPIFEVIDKVR